MCCSGLPQKSPDFAELPPKKRLPGADRLICAAKSRTQMMFRFYHIPDSDSTRLRVAFLARLSKHVEHFIEMLNIMVAERARTAFIDVAAGEKIPRKGGPGITRSALLVINKIDLAPYVGASLEIMERDAKKMRGDRPFVFTNMHTGEGVDQVVDFIVKQGLLDEVKH